MQVLLIQDVDNLGYAGDVKKVADGFGRNYLIPRSMAVLATPGALKQAETIRKAAEKRRAHETSDAQAVANQLAGLELFFERRAGDTGKLYGSVTSADISDAVKAKSGLEVDKRKVALPEPIRQLGQQDVTIKLMIDVATSVKVHVLPEGGILERERLRRVEEERLLAQAAKEKPVEKPVAEVAVAAPVKEAAAEPPVEEVVAEAPVEEVAAEAPVEEAAAEAPVEEVAAEAPAEETEAAPPAEEVAAEAPVEEPEAEQPVEEVAAEAPVEEVAAEPATEDAEAEPPAEETKAE